MSKPKAKDKKSAAEIKSPPQGPEVHFDQILDAIPDPIFVKDRQHNWIFGNEAFGKILKLPRDKYLGLSDPDLFPQEMAEHFWRLDNEVFNSGKGNEIEERVLGSDGEEHIIWTKKTVCTDKEGNPILVGIIRDISEHRKRDLEIQSLRSLVENLNDIVGYWDHFGNLIWVNSVASRSFGWDIAKEKNIFNYLSEESDRALLREGMAFAKNGKLWEGEVNMLDQSKGELVPFALKICAIRDSQRSDPYFGTIATDIRQKRVDQMTLVESKKMASLGEMVGGLAHEINNPLTIIQGKSSHLISLLDSGDLTNDKLRKDLEKIEETAGRIAKIVRGLRTVSRNTSGDPFAEVSLESILGDTISLCQERFNHAQVELKVEAKSNFIFECRSAQIVQVLLNLLNNALDAVKDRDEAWVKLEAQEIDMSVEISVTDSGRGIARNIVARMMEPFFTTKPPGQGTGLGLSISQAIAETHRGRLFYDDKSSNTKFVIILPKCQPAAA